MNVQQRNKNRTAIVTGMNGVGKDFLISKVIKSNPIKVAGWGDLLSEELGVDKDIMMKTVDPEMILQGQYAVCDKVMNMQPLVAICHVVKLENGRYVYNLEIEKRLNPMYYVFVSAPAELIAERVRKRNLSGERSSHEMSTKEIAEVQKIRLKAMKELAEVQQTKLVILNNIDAELDINLNTLDNLINHLKQGDHND